MIDTHRICFKQTHKKIDYNVYVSKPRDVSITIFLAEYIFLNAMKNKSPLKTFNTMQGRLSDFEKKKLEQITDIKITRITKEESIFEVEV